MTSLIRADLGRILRKRSFLAVIFLSAADSAGSALWARNDVWNGFAYAVNQGSILTGICVFLIGLSVFLSIFADDFVSGAMKVVVGRGFSRTSVIIAKVIDCVLLTILSYGFLAAFQILLGVLLGAGMSPDDVKNLLLCAVSGAFQVICCTHCAAVVFFLTDNTPFSTFMDLAFLGIIPIALNLMSGSVIFHNIHISNYYISGFAQRFFSDAMLGGGAALTLVTGTLIWLGIPSLLSILIFGKKELDL